MNEFGRLIADILRQLTLAQHQSNLLTGALAKEYATHETLRFLPVPNASIRTFEIALRFALEEVLSQADASDAGAVRDALDGWWADLVCDLCAAAALSSSVANALTAEGSPATALGDAGAEGGRLEPVLRAALRRLSEEVVPSFELAEAVEASRLALAQKLVEGLGADPEAAGAYQMEAVFDMTRLGGLDQALVSEIRVAVDMRGFSTGTLYSRDGAHGPAPASGSDSGSDSDGVVFLGALS